MKRLVISVVVAIILISSMTVSAFASSGIVCPVCGNSNTISAACSGAMVGYPVGVTCPLQGETRFGAEHAEQCTLMQVYCRTDIYCSFCNRTSPGATKHYCWFWHTMAKPEATGSVCKFNLNGSLNAFSPVSISQQISKVNRFDLCILRLSGLI